jgi:hypothetical protein
MKPEDEQPTEDELREAAALAAALETDGAPADAGAAAPADTLETAALLRHARAPLVVPPAQEPIATARAVEALDARRTRGRRTRVWIGASIVAPAAAATWLLFAMTARREAPPRPIQPPAPSASLLAAHAEATRGGDGARAALARLDLEMRAYRRQYHDDLRRRGGPR